MDRSLRPAFSMGSFVLLACLLWQGCPGTNLEEYHILDVADLEEPANPQPLPAATPQEVPPGTQNAAEPTPDAPETGTVAATGSSEIAPTAATPAQAANSSLSPAADAPPAADAVESPTVTPVEFSPGGINANANSLTSTSSSLIPELKREIKLLVAEKTFLPEGAARALRVTFDDIDLLKVLNMDPVTLDAVDHMPSWLTGLDGKTVRLRGWMYPPASQTGISRFIFVRDNGVCCFGPKAKIYDKVAVTLKDGVETDFIQGHAFDIIGTFTVAADVFDGELQWLYAMDDCVIVDE